MPWCLKMREKQKNGLVETVKRCFDDSAKNIDWSTWMNKSRNCSSRVEHTKRIILNAFQRVHFETIFWCYMNFKIIFWKAGVFMLYICYTVVNMKKDKLNCQFDLVRNFDACVESLFKMFLNVSELSSHFFYKLMTD